MGGVAFGGLDCSGVKESSEDSSSGASGVKDEDEDILLERNESGGSVLLNEWRSQIPDDHLTLSTEFTPS